jgi:tRNA threonylcarbamoyladenosine modification (KEOPS) complex  Pcc1 subunit
LQAKIQLNYRDEKTAEAIAKAVSPDNFKTPEGLKISTLREKNKVVTEVECSGKLATFTATIDDLLFSASTAEKTVKAVKKL